MKRKRSTGHRPLVYGKRPSRTRKFDGYRYPDYDVRWLKGTGGTSEDTMERRWGLNGSEHLKHGLRAGEFAGGEMLGLRNPTGLKRRERL